MREIAFIEFDSTEHPTDAVAGGGGKCAYATFHA
ncbi:MAG: hypothetical protein QOF90_1495 [Acetobacteraceae bacterium]|jgi:hypothetical protein|nr:hypothetical protein [Acetobacteraceae bacterium]MEA2787772.1 hypothetical protein [Acetobacteraceae bacterium]